VLRENDSYVLTRINSTKELYTRVPWGKKKQPPGLRSLKKNNSCSYKWSMFLQSSVEKANHLANLAMVALGSFSQERLVLCQLLLVRE
jgi:hypothetical protein